MIVKMNCIGLHFFSVECFNMYVIKTFIILLLFKSYLDLLFRLGKLVNKEKLRNEGFKKYLKQTTSEHEIPHQHGSRRDSVVRELF